MKYLSTFSGVGGFELGIQLAYEDIKNRESLQGSERRSIRPEGAEPVSAVWSDEQSETRRNRFIEQPENIGFSEIDKYATAIYQKHFPNHKNYGDITTINAETLPDFDLLVGGFPCQAFSIAGKRGGFEDTRGTMFFELARILRAKQPRLFVFENVKGLLSHDNGQTFRTIIATLDELGYDTQWQVLNSKNHGVPQNRERVFIIGHLRGTPRPQVFPFGENDNLSDRETEPEQRRTQTEVSTTVRGGMSTKADGTYIEVEGYLQNEKWDRFNESSRRVYGTGGIAPTIPTVAGGGHTPKIVHDIVQSLNDSGLEPTENGWESLDNLQEIKIRRLTPTECERLQGFPDGWTEGVSDTQRYKTLGNAVTVNVIRDIFEKIL